MAEVEGFPVTTGEAEVEPRFRAVRRGNYRRGIRLERIYWKTLSDMSAAEGLAIADLVRKAELRFPLASNLTSLLRVICLRWLQDQLDKARRLAGPAMVEGLVHASPAPAFALTEDKRIIVYNQAFLNFLRARLPVGTDGSPARDLRLSLDTQIGELIELLSQNRNRPVGTGFAVGVEERRVRGRLNMVLAPSTERTVVIGYVLPG